MSNSRTIFNQRPNKIHVQKGRNWEDDKHRHDTTRNRAGKQLDRIDDISGETNPYKECIVNNVEKIEPLVTQIEWWSILSTVLNYVQHSIFNSMNHTLDVKAMNRYKSKPDTDRKFKELDFGVTPQKLQEKYMDIHEGIHSDIVSSNRFDENSDISTTYLGKIENRGNQDK